MCTCAGIERLNGTDQKSPERSPKISGNLEYNEGVLYSETNG